MDKLDHIQLQLTQLITAQALHNAEQKSMQEQIKSIHRGMYGDEVNGLVGLVKGHHDQEERIKSLEESRSRAKWTAAGIGIGVQGIGLGIWSWIKNNF